MHKNPKDNATDQDESLKELQFSRGIYATGHAAKDGFIWGLVASLATIGILAFGEKFPVIARAQKAIEQGHEASKVFFAKAFPGKVSSKITGPVIAVGVFVGGIIGHIVPIPSAVRGWQKAQHVVDTYDQVKADKARLKVSNEALAHEVEELKGGEKKFAAALSAKTPAAIAQAQLAEVEQGTALTR